MRIGGDVLKRENIWQSIACDGIFEMMRLLHCEKKYLDGTASDFECFREVIPLCSSATGHGAVTGAADKIGELFGVSVSEEQLCALCARETWRAFEGGLALPINTAENLYKNRIEYDLELCDEKEYILSGESRYYDFAKIKERSFDDFVKNIEKSNDYRFFIEAEATEFERPDRYHASEYYDRYIHGEKYNISVIILQSVFEMIYKKRRVIIHLKIDGRAELDWANKLLEYMSMRNISEKIFVRVGENITPEDVKRLCMKYENAVPVMVEKSREYICEFAKIYPIGAALII
jgi:hypothetical protein